MSGLLVILEKEIKDSLRDRRALAVAMLPAIFGPFLMMYMLSTAAETRSDADNLELAVIGAAHAPDLIAFLERNEVQTQAFEGDPKTEIQAKNVNAILSIPEDYGENFAAFRPATLSLFADESLEKSERAADKISDLLRSYSRNLGTMRLMIRGVDPSIAAPVRLQIKDFSTRKARASKILASMQMILLMAAFFGGAGAAIDTTAGERERSSLEPLLVHPVTSLQITGGKWITVAIYGVAACLLAVLSTAAALETFSLEALGVDPNLGTGMQLGIFAVLVPMAFLASSMQMLVSLFAKTFKEAQSYLGLLTMLPMVPIMVTLFRELKTAAWMYLVPILGQQQLITSVMRGEGLDQLGFLTAAGVTIATAGGFFLVLTKLLRSERVVYGS